ncbi:hypothetical protein L873DRAFT_1826348 [Choiromyces venosus 120613-1]|uniref:Rhodopsin domain-containing protein n=1 Tax=Choiromyces venosus 120613-1 TaxID=1336337 RepID=A0A3N4JY59_9PEZI|nr:hypothetical protein L873DRAFT_1826348 [Choiromyces venosus 120613-1]
MSSSVLCLTEGRCNKYFPCEIRHWDYAAIIIPTLKLWYVYQLQYLLTLFFIKASILSFYRRISPKRSYQISVWIVSGIVVAYTVAMLFIFECPKDPSRAWAADFPKGCDNVVDVHYFMMAPFNILSDIVILLLPLPSLLGLQINKRKRAALLLIFSCGFIAVAASIGRLNALYKHRHALIAGGDAPYMATYILLWSQIEVNVGIITASAPALGPLVRSILRGTSYAKSCYTGTGQKSKHGIPLHSLGGRETNRPHGNTTTVEGGANESQEDIVSKNDGIIRTVEVKVDVEANGRSEDSIRQLEFGR